MNDKKSLHAIAWLTGIALIAPSGARADTASDQADVALRQAKVDLLKSQIPASPDKSLTPSAPAAPSLNASTDRNVYRLTQAIAGNIATSIVTDVKSGASGVEIVLDDGKARAAVGTYKSVTAALEVMRRNLDSRRTVLEHTVIGLSPPVSGREHDLIAPLVAATVVAGVVQAVVGFAELMKPQYGFGSTTQQSVADVALSAAVTQSLSMRPGLRVVDFGASVSPCIDGRAFSVPVGSLACDPAAPQLLGALKVAFFQAVDDARQSIAAVDHKNFRTAPDDDQKKDLAEKRSAVQATIDDSLKAWATLNTVDGAGGVSNLDAAERVEPILLRMATRPKGANRSAATDRIAFLTVQSIAADSDVVVDTRWYAPLRIGMESVVVARWRLTDVDGQVVKQQLLCWQTNRASIPLRDGATSVPEIRPCPTEAVAGATSQ